METIRLKDLCKYLVKTEFQDLPEEVIESTKYVILDFLGCVFSGYEEESTKIVLSFIDESSDIKDASIIGYGKTSTQLAALANGVLGHSKELDDEHKCSATHIGVTVIPAALALVENNHKTGKDLITSIVLGYEVAARIGMSICSDVLPSKGFHPTGVIGVFGSTATTSKILDLNRNTLMSALGIAGSFSSGLFEFVSDGCWTKRLHPGWAAQNGITAAFLAKKGFDPLFGARPLDRFIETNINDPISREILFGSLTKGGSIKVGLRGEELTFKYS